MLAKVQQECFINIPFVTIPSSAQNYSGQIMITKKKKLKGDSTKNASSGYQPENHTSIVPNDN